ncbi:nucleoside hydrolase [Mariniflexile maritimum]|uniref:nucleoside hydrolase n=1 Tax=Mariniflexile maritimum TaxID=2682493 RepID=UPI0012F62AD6|nr:nucleoside hydrolase [Mariniflexile maritimum]
MTKIYLAVLTVLLIKGCPSLNTDKIKKEDIKESKIKVLFETDMGNDVDDALALDMLYKYVDEGKIDLLGIMSNKESPYSSEYTDIMNTWYGYPQIPIGIIRNGPDCENDATNYAKSVSLLQNEKGEQLFKRSLKNHNQLPDAHILYRKILSEQPDNSVTIISVGFSTNLARLLETPADDISRLTGKELVAKKVELLSTMAGCFNNDELFEYNVVKDISAAKKVFAEWPTPLVTSPFEVGIAIKYPGSSIENDFSWASIHPMVEAYKSYLEMPYDRPTWDLTSVLYAVEGASYFNLSLAGKINVTEKGATKFTPESEGTRYYLTVDSIQGSNIKQHLIDLLTKQPIHFNK